MACQPEIAEKRQPKDEFLSGSFVTTTMADYNFPDTLPQHRARRKEMLKRFYWNQFSREFYDELGKMPSDEDSFAKRTTTYGDEFGIPGFQPKSVLELMDPEMFIKYPLYGDAPYSVYMEKIGKTKPSVRTKHPLTVFRKSSVFARKWYDELE